MLKSIVLYSILFVAIIYTLIGFGLLYDGQKGLGIAYIFYACSNLGLYYAALGV